MFGAKIRIFLRPGLGLKRWLVMLALGLVLFSIGVGFLMESPVSPKILPILRYITLENFSPVTRGLVFITVGVIINAYPAFKSIQWLIAAARQKDRNLDILTAMDRKRRLGQGLNIVAIGGGTGLSTVLRGLKHATSNITAIVTIADDGGSSGRLGTDLQMPPPGDARNCLVALSGSEPLLEELFNYRFDERSSLQGHSLGNLILAALYDMRGGFHESLEAAGSLLALQGRVIPVSEEEKMVLKGETIDGTLLQGESEVGHAPAPIKKVWIEPITSQASETAISAIDKADLIVIGPGSLYTSIIPNFLVGGIKEALSKSNVAKVFICNVSTQDHETDGYGVKEHLQAFSEHSGVSPSHILVNNNVRDSPIDSRQTVIAPVSQISYFNGTIIDADLLDLNLPNRHDPEKLAAALLTIWAHSRIG